MFNRNTVRAGGKKKSGLTRGLTIAAVTTFVFSLGCTVWYSYTHSYSAMIDLQKVHLIQLEEPQADAPRAVMHTTAGDMTYVLYPEQCPKAVENFVQLAESGYYDGTYVYAVEQGTVFAGGSPNADGSLADAAAAETAQELVPRELSPDLWPFRGALCALTTKEEAGFFRTLTGRQQYYNGSRFLVADTIEMTDDVISGLKEQGEDNPVVNALIEQGGIPNYAQQMTVFGQLIEGFDVLDAITDCELAKDDTRSYPAEDIIIQSIEIAS